MPDFAVRLHVLAEVFLRMVKMIIAPLLFATLVVGIAGHGDVKSLGRLGIKTIAYFEIVTTLALFIGLGFANFFRPGEGMASDDSLTYYLSCATRNSSLEYAAYASVLALAFRKAGAEKKMIQFRDSAKKAWQYALNPANRKKCLFHIGSKTLFYREEPEPAPEFLVKAGFNLFQLTGDLTYLRKAEDAVETIIDEFTRLPTNEMVVDQILAKWK